MLTQNNKKVPSTLKKKKVVSVKQIRFFSALFWRNTMTTTLEHLKTRHLNVELYHSLYVSEEEQTVFFPLWNLLGQMVGYQQVRPFAPKNDSELEPKQKRYFTWIRKFDKKTQHVTAFGLDLLNPKKKVLFVCEGVFDACRLHNLGLNALALLSCDPKPLKAWLWLLGYEIVPICEGDKAGLKMAKLSSHGRVEYLNEGEDLGDMTEKAVYDKFEKYL
jgi:hypothetical protein